jgi:hypothetical protein
VKIITAVLAPALAAVGGGFTVFGGYDDSPGGQLLGVLVVLGAMAFSARSAARNA